MGGLGNQMFQIAAAYSVASSNNDFCHFNFDKCYTPLQGHPSNRYKNNIFKNIKHSNDIIVEHVHKEKDDQSYEKIEYKNNLMLHGYFQKEKYFKNNISDIKNNLFYLNPKDCDFLSSKFKLNEKRSVSVHIRRGDYLKFSDIHPICDLLYYKKAIDFFGKNYNFIFVSDDIEWVKQNFNADNYYYSCLNNEILDFTLLTLCHDNIIANSTFSWWGAYLGKYKDKKVIAPAQWFGKEGPNGEDIVLKNWIKL